MSITTPQTNEIKFMNPYAGRVSNLLKSYFYSESLDTRYKDHEDYLELLDYLIGGDPDDLKRWRNTDDDIPLSIYHKNHKFPSIAVPLLSFDNFFTRYESNYLSEATKRDLVVHLFNNFLRINQDYLNPDVRYLLIPEYRLSKNFMYKADILLCKIQTIHDLTPLAIVDTKSVHKMTPSHVDSFIGQLTRYRAHIDKSIIFCNFSNSECDECLDMLLDVSEVLKPLVIARGLEDLLLTLCYVIEEDLNNFSPILPEEFSD